MRFSVLVDFVFGFAVLDEIFFGFAVSNIPQSPLVTCIDLSYTTYKRKSLENSYILIFFYLLHLYKQP